MCASPAIAEIVFALGAGPRVVGVSEFTLHPPEAAAKPSVGGLMNPNRERLLTLKPDAIITQGQHEALRQFCSGYGIRFLSVRLDTLDDLFRAATSIGRDLRLDAEAERLVRDLRHQLAALRSRVGERPPRRVLLVVGRAPGDLTGITSVGRGSFLHDLVAIAVGSNIFADAIGLYPQVSKESLVFRAPEAILEIRPDGLPEPHRIKLVADWSRLDSLPAVRDGRIAVLTNDYLLIPGPRIGLTVQRMAEAIHPEAFP